MTRRWMAIVALVAALCFGSALAQTRDISAGCGPERALLPIRPAPAGPDVVELQQRLDALGYGPLESDGIYGPQTISAVLRFQEARGLAQDGVVGKSTWSELGGFPVETAQSPSDPPQGSLSIVVDTDNLTLTLYADGEPYKQYPVAVGRPNQYTLSPVGEWRVIQKSLDWGGGFGTRWLGLNVPWGIYGIHGTNKPWSIGTRASAGCIRMLNRDVEELYEWVPVGTPVAIRGDAPEVTFNRRLRAGHTGRDVVLLQLRLQELGFDAQGADGRFGPNTVQAVKALQRRYGLPEDGEAYDDVYYILGLR